MVSHRTTTPFESTVSVLIYLKTSSLLLCTHVRQVANFLLIIHNPRMTAYADKMAHDKFDGTQGFSIDGGIKDSGYYFRLHRERSCSV